MATEKATENPFAASKKLKVRILVNAFDTLDECSKQAVTYEQAIQVLGLLKWARAKMQIFQDKRLEIAKKYGESIEAKGEPPKVQLSPAKIPEFNKEVEPLLDMDLDFPDELQISQETLKNISISAVALERILPFFRK